MKNDKQRVRVGLISLGCAKNLVDAEIMLGSLMKEGIEITNDSEEADVLIVNTCSFIDSAQEESVDAILQSDQLREVRNRDQGLIVSGCLPQRFREELPKLLPEVDAFMGIDQVAEIPSIVREAMEHRAKRLASKEESKPTAKTRVTRDLAELERKREPVTDAPLVHVNPRPQFIPDFDTPRFRLTPGHSAYVKIAEGCNHPCTFCTIPRMRGSHRSRPQSDIVREARQLVADGALELNLISQDSTYYGLDFRSGRGSISSPEKFKAATKGLPEDSTTLCTLLRGLNEIPGDFWIRLLYTHPAHWTDELIETIADCPKVARYVDIPLQHIHANMLERMRRETSQEYIVELMDRIRTGIPGIALRTTFIVGFPGETESYFNTLLKFIRDTRFERLGVFTYSKEDSTRAAAMKAQVTDRVKNRRRDQAMAAQLEIAREIGASFVGRTIKVLVENDAREMGQAEVSSWEHGLIREEGLTQEKLKGRYMVARGEADAPDIDGRVYVRGRLTPGKFAQVKVIGHTDYDLIAKPV